MAYCYALLSAPSYTRRLANELRTPGPRVPLTLEGVTFQRGNSLGQRLLTLHTYREVVRGKAGMVRPLGAIYPTDYGYDPARESLWLGDGCFGDVSREVWEYAVSRYRVVPGWLRRRVLRKGRSPLDAIGPERWEDRLTEELLELLWLIEATLAVGPALDALLDEAISGGGLSAGVGQAKSGIV
jgi:hypothetical protein